MTFPLKIVVVAPDLDIADPDDEHAITQAESDARDALEHVVMATRDERRPIVMFTNDDDTRHVKDAVAAGVSAYIVAGLSPERIRPILDVALARFQHEQALLQTLASSMGLQTIAEGVETASQLAYLRLQGCDEVQGYYFSRPVPADAFEAFVRQQPNA